MPDPHELEGKFACGPDDLERALGFEQIGDFHLTARNERIQTDTYYDTATLALRAASSSLRLRETGDAFKATFKGPRQAVGSRGRPAEHESHLFKRVEIEVAVSPPPDGQAPFTERADLEPVSRARAIAGAEEALQPIARLVTRRRTQHYQRGAAEEVELALDEVDARDLRDGRETAMCEIEIELIEGDEATLISAATALRAALPGLRPSARSKLARALGE
jgi:inorganic triphosphatase YgiF